MRPCQSSIVGHDTMQSPKQAIGIVSRDTEALRRGARPAAVTIDIDQRIRESVFGLAPLRKPSESRLTRMSRLGCSLIHFSGSLVFACSATGGDARSNNAKMTRGVASIRKVSSPRLIRLTIMDPSASFACLPNV